MENQMNFVELVLFALGEPRYSRQEFLKIKQTESGFSVNVFRHKLEDAITLWYKEIHKNDWRIISKNVYDMSLSLTDCSKGKVIGSSFGDKELALLALDIDEAFQETNDSNTKIEDDSKGFYKFQVLKLWYEKDCIPLDEKMIINLYNGIKKNNQDTKCTVQRFKIELESLHRERYKSNENRGNPKAFSRAYKKLIETFSNNPKLKEAVKKDYDELKENYPTKQL